MKVRINGHLMIGGVVAIIFLLTPDAVPRVQASEVLSCTVIYHSHKHSLSILLENNRLMEIDYQVSITKIPAGNDICGIGARRTDPDLLWAAEGQTTFITEKASEFRPLQEQRWYIFVNHGCTQWIFDFRGPFICGPSAVHATKIALQRNNKRCVLLEVSE
jgi:hypothetical protein